MGMWLSRARWVAILLVVLAAGCSSSAPDDSASPGDRQDVPTTPEGTRAQTSEVVATTTPGAEPEPAGTPPALEPEPSEPEASEPERGEPERGEPETAATPTASVPPPPPDCRQVRVSGLSGESERAIQVTFTGTTEQPADVTVSYSVSWEEDETSAESSVIVKHVAPGEVIRQAFAVEQELAAQGPGGGFTCAVTSVEPTTEGEPEVQPGESVELVDTQCALNAIPSANDAGSGDVFGVEVMFANGDDLQTELLVHYVVRVDGVRRDGHEVTFAMVGEGETVQVVAAHPRPMPELGDGEQDVTCEVLVGEQGPDLPEHVRRCRVDRTDDECDAELEEEGWVIRATATPCRFVDNGIRNEIEFETELPLYALRFGWFVNDQDGVRRRSGIGEFPSADYPAIIDSDPASGLPDSGADRPDGDLTDADLTDAELTCVLLD